VSRIRDLLGRGNYRMWRVSHQSRGFHLLAQLSPGGQVTLDYSTILAQLSPGGQVTLDYYSQISRSLSAHYYPGPTPPWIRRSYKTLSSLDYLQAKVDYITTTSQTFYLLSMLM
jgi:hypothetical protein